MMDERAVSQALGYVIGLGIVALLISALVFSGGVFIEEQREEAIRSELKVVGQQVSNELSRTDRMVESANVTGTISISARAPRDVAGKGYRIEVVTSTANPHLILTTSNPDVRARVNITVETDLQSSTINGGTYRIVYDPSSKNLEVTDD